MTAPSRDPRPSTLPLRDAEPTLWDRLVAWSRRNPLGVLLLVVAAAAPAAYYVVDLARTFFPPRADLVLSSLGEAGRVRSTLGVPPVATARGPVYAHGAEVRLTLSSDVGSAHEIAVRGIEPEVVAFDVAERADLDYGSVGEKGLQEASVFALELDGKDVRPALWQDPAGARRSRSANVLDVSPPRVLVLSATRGASEELVLQLLPARPGLYTVRFAVRYAVAGEDRVQHTGTFRIYRRGSVADASHRKR